MLKILQIRDMDSAKDTERHYLIDACWSCWKYHVKIQALGQWTKNPPPSHMPGLWMRSLHDREEAQSSDYFKQQKELPDCDDSYGRWLRRRENNLNKKVRNQTEREWEVLTLWHLSLFSATLRNMVLQHEPNKVAINSSFSLSTGSWAAGESNRALLLRKWAQSRRRCRMPGAWGPTKIMQLHFQEKWALLIRKMMETQTGNEEMECSSLGRGVD